MADDEPSRVGRWLAVSAVVAIVVMWLYIFSGVASDDPPDTLDGDAFPQQAESLCAAAVAELEALPTAGETETATARADVLDAANRVLATMVDDLGALDVADPTDRELVGRWIDDWRTYLADRRDYAEDLRVDASAELLITARAGRQITLTVDRFANVNDMPSCVTPLDA